MEEAAARLSAASKGLAWDEGLVETMRKEQDKADRYMEALAPNIYVREDMVDLMTEQPIKPTLEEAVGAHVAAAMVDAQHLYTTSYKVSLTELLMRSRNPNPIKRLLSNLFYDAEELVSRGVLLVLWSLLGWALVGVVLTLVWFAGPRLATLPGSVMDPTQWPMLFQWAWMLWCGASLGYVVKNDL